MLETISLTIFILDYGMTSHDLISEVTSFKMAAPMVCYDPPNLHLIRTYQGHDGVIPQYALIRSPQGRSTAPRCSTAIRPVQLGIQNRNGPHPRSLQPKYNRERRH